MTFSYDITAGFTDLTRVRFHTGDVVAEDAKFSDEEITSVIAESGSWQKAVIALLENLVLRLCQPNFQADWLKVDVSTARAGYVVMLAEKKQTLKLSRRAVGTAVHPARADLYPRGNYRNDE